MSILDLGVVAVGVVVTPAPRPRPTAPTSAPAPTTIISALPTMKQAFDLAFPGGGDIDLQSRSIQGPLRYHFEPIAVVPIQGGVALISKGAVPDGAHAFGGVLGIHYLGQGPGGWRVVGSWPNLAESGSFGEIGSATLRDDLFDGPAVALTGGGTWQGCSVAETDLVELTPSKPTIRASGILVDYGRDGADDETEGKIAPAERGRSFLVRYTGGYSRTVTYKRVGETFAPSANSEGLPSC